MIDLSNNNGTGHDYARAYASGHHRIYFKASESVNFTDSLFRHQGERAHHARFRVGAYHFAHATHSPLEEFEHFASCIHGLAFPLQLRPALDLEHGTPRATLGAWALEWLQLCRHHLGADAIVYGSGWFLEACQFKRKPAGLWLASYGRNDGREHPYHVPAPWTRVDAHQFSSEARIPGIRGRCDVSRVILPSAIDWPGR